MTASPPTRYGFELEASRDAEVAIHTHALDKAYKVYDKPFNFLKEALTGRAYHRDKHALRDISITIRRGEIVGVIGRNGAGKSTLLKIIAGTLAPTQGSVTVNGRVSAILELGTGFNPSYSGRDNVILSALMRGMPEAEVLRKFDSIVAFAGLEDVINQPFHTYSSGMQARLAFAAAVSVEADVLIIDEALAAGDIRFASRSLRRIHEICQSGVTALFVSHVTYHVMQLCTRAIWIDDGRIRMDGPPIDVVRAYEYEMHDAIARDQGRVAAQVANGNEQIESSTGALPDTATMAADAAITAPPPQEADVVAVTLAEPAQNSEGEHGNANVEVGAVVAPASSAHDLASIEARAKARHFSTGHYRIVKVAFLDRNGKETQAFRFGESLRLRVAYECLQPELPEYSCGLAVAFNRTSDFEAVMYFNTNYPHSDEELHRYFELPFRKYVGRKGVIEAVIDPIQLKAGEYYVSFGILPNQPGHHEFYEYFHCDYYVRILPNGFDEPSVFYPAVSWTNGPFDADG